MRGLTESIGKDAVASLCEAGWECPVRVCATAANGPMVYLCFDRPDSPPRLLAAHGAAMKPESPVVFLITARLGKAATLVVDGDAIGSLRVID